MILHASLSKLSQINISHTPLHNYSTFFAGELFKNQVFLCAFFFKSRIFGPKNLKFVFFLSEVEFLAVDQHWNLTLIEIITK